MIPTFARELTKMINAGLGLETVAPDTSVAVGRYSEYIEVSDEAVATFDTNAALPLRALTVNIDPIQSGTGDPSPENVRPITGRQNVTIRRIGKNLLSPGESGTKGGLTFTVNSDGTVTVGSGTANASSTYALSTVNLVAGETYALSGCPSTGGQGKFGLALYVAGTVVANDFGSGATYTPAANVEAEVRIRYWYGQSAAGLYKPQLESGPAFTAYEPYNGDTIGFETSETIYGGTVDAVSGVMTVDRAMVTYDGSDDENWDTGTGRFVITIDDIRNINARNEIIANIGYYSASSATDGVGAMFAFAKKIYYYAPTSITTATEFREWLSSNNLSVVYYLATPLTIQLSAQQLTTLLGTNNVWSDGGNVSLTYTKYNYTEGY